MSKLAKHNLLTVEIPSYREIHMHIYTCWVVCPRSNINTFFELSESRCVSDSRLRAGEVASGATLADSVPGQQRAVSPSCPQSPSCRQADAHAAQRCSHSGSCRWATSPCQPACTRRRGSRSHSCRWAW